MRRVCAALFLLMLLAPTTAFAQVAWPAEADWDALQKDGVPVDDIEGDVTGSRDIVGDAADPAAYVYADATHLMFRLRLDEDPRNNAGTDLRPFSWGVEFETDGNLDNFEALVMVNGIANPDIVTLQQNTVQGTIGDPSDQAEIVVATYLAADNSRVTAAASMFSADADFFLDFAVLWSDLAMIGILPGDSFGIILGSGSSANAFAADIGTSIADSVSDPVTCSTSGCNLAGLTIDSPADGSTVSTDTPMVTGTTEPNTDVTLVYNAGTGDEVTVTVTADANGDFTDTPPALPQGTNTIDASVTINNETTTTSITFTVDSIAPVVTIDEPADGSATNDVTPTIMGTAEANADVTVVVNPGTADEESATVTADGNGEWTYAVVTPLSEGPNSVDASQTDAAGNTGSATSTFDVDTIAPVVTIDTPADGSSSTDRRPTLSGTADPNMDVRLVFNAGTASESTVTVTADANGDWTFVPTFDLPTGANTITASQVDAAGNTGSDSVSITIDVGGDVAINTPVDGAVIGDAYPEISGTGEPGASVDITIDAGTADETTVTVTVDNNGDWTYTPVDALSDGAHTVDVSQDDNGNVTMDSVAFDVDLTAPMVQIDNPTDGSTTSDGTPTIDGSSDEAGITVSITINAGTPGEETATVTTDANGDWTYTVMNQLADGQHTIDVRATDGAGNEGTDSVTFSVGADAPTIVISSPMDGATVTDSQPTVSGQADPGEEVDIIIDEGTADEQTATVTADANGNWSYTVGTALANGMHTIRASVTNADGVTASDSVDITVDATPEGIAINDPADGSTIATGTPTVSGTAAPGATIEVTIDGNTYTTTASDTGNWSVEITDELEDGDQMLTATQLDADGNPDGEATITFTVDTTPPVLTVETPAEGDEVSGTPTVTGTAEPGATIEVYIDGVLVGTTIADTDGNWSFDVPEENAAGAGDHVITVIARDDAGNETSIDINVTVGEGNDRDGDGISDDVEEMLGTDPDDPDTDGDGLEDGEEVNEWNTDPLDPDSDDDGLNDGAEIDNNTNPNAEDTDFDGLNDGEEVNEYGSDPRNPDTDGGGVFDGVEAENGTDLLDPDDDRAGTILLSGGGCSQAPGQARGGLWLLFGLAFWRVRRRRS